MIIGHKEFKLPFFENDISRERQRKLKDSLWLMTRVLNAKKKYSCFNFLYTFLH